MSDRKAMSHPEEEQLLRFADGEPTSRSTSAIRSHLEACWQCRTELEEMQSTVAECIRYRKNVLQRHLPAPPEPWADIYRGFDAIDAGLDRVSFWERVTRILLAPLHNTKRWAPVAVALVVLCVLFYRFRQTPSVQAAELLRKAIAAADARPEAPRRLQIRTRDARLTRVSGAPDTDALRPVQALFQAAHYDWNDPLSAKSYQAWRDGLADKRDEVMEDQDAYSIRTHSGSGELVEATLKIRRQDLRPVEERFEFGNREWVEITELPAESAPDAPPAIAAPGGRAVATSEARTKPPSAAVSPEPATAGDQVRVLVALNRVGADLGDPIEVSRAGGEIVVSGVGVDPRRQQEIRDALRSQPHVAVHFSEAITDKAPPDTAPQSDSAAAADIELLQARMAEQIGGRGNFVRLSSQVLDLTEPMMSRAYALRRLAEQFPREAESELAAQDRRLLGSLVSEHTSALQRQTAELDRLLRPALGSAKISPEGAALTSAWQPATEELFQSARRLDKIVAVIFGAAAGDSSIQPSPTQLMSSLAQLRRSLDSYDRISRQTLERSEK